MQEQNPLTSRFYSQYGSRRKGFIWRGIEFQKTISSIIRHLRWPQPNCKQWRKSRAPDDKWRLYKRQDQINFLLSYNHGTSWKGYFKIDSGIASFHGPYSLTGNIRNKRVDSSDKKLSALLLKASVSTMEYSLYVKQKKTIPVSSESSILFTWFRFLLLNLPHRTEGMFCNV